jgi:hypothetical protein
MKKFATLLALIAAFAIAVPLAAQAKNGADDPVGHVRHSGIDRPGDDGVRHSTKAAKLKAATASKSGRNGADDAPGDDNGHQGNDDGPNHS